MTGSKVKLWKHDPTVGAIGARTAYIHTPVDHGPKDSEIEIKGLPPAHHDSNRDFLYDHDNYMRCTSTC